MNIAKKPLFEMISRKQAYIARLAGAFLATMVILTILARGVAGVMAAQVSVSQPFNDKIVQKTEISATVNAARSSELSFPIPLTITEILVKNGETVEVGTPLAVVDMKELKQKLAEEQIALETLKLSLKKLDQMPQSSDSVIADLEKKLTWTLEDYNAQKEKGERELEGVRHSLDIAVLGQEKAQSELDLVGKDSTSDEYAKAKEERDIARKAVKLAKERLANLEKQITPETPYTSELKELRSALAAAQVELEVKESACDALWDIAKEEWKAAQGVVEAAKEAVYAANQNLAQTIKSNEEALRNANRTVELARTELETAKKELVYKGEKAEVDAFEGAINAKAIRLDIEKSEDNIKSYKGIPSDGRLLSPYDGTLSQITKKGATNPKDVIVAVFDMSNGYTAVAEISSKLDFKVGMTGTVLSSELFGQESEKDEARLSYINKGVSEDKVEAVFEIEGDYDLYDTVQIEVVEGTSPMSTCVPISSLHQGIQGYYVFVIASENNVLGTQSVVHMVTVVVTQKNNESAAIKGGITTKDKVVTFSSKMLADGDVVREKTV